jgi:hypothetical protein
LTEEGELKYLDGESQEDLAEAEKYVDYRLRKHEKEESDEELQLAAVNKPLRPLYPSDTSPRIEKLKLYNKIDPVEYVKSILGDVHFPPWLHSPIVSQESDGSMKLLEDNLQTEFIVSSWKPLDIVQGSRQYSLYVTLVNRIGYIDRLIQTLNSRSNDPVPPLVYSGNNSNVHLLVGALRTIQDQYQLLSLHMELKNQYSNSELVESYGNEYGDESRYHYNYGISPIQLYPPLIETSVFDLEELPDLFILVLYCEYWGDRLELPFKDAELIKLVDLLSKALPYPCKGRSVTSILPNSWSGGSVDNSIVYRVMSRLIMGSFLGCYPHCQVKAGFAVRRKLYKRFYLTPPQPEELSSWISKNKFLVIYIMREFLFYSIQAMPAVHKFMKDVYYWTDITTNTFQAMDEVRQRTNTAVEQFGGYIASPILEFDGEPTWESYLSQIYYNTDIKLSVTGSDVTFEQDIYQRSLETDDATETKSVAPTLQSMLSTAIPPSTSNNKKQGRITKKRVKITSDPLVSVEETTKYDVSYQDDNAWYSHMNDVLSKYNSTNLDHCHRPIDMNFLDKLVFQMNKIIDENYSGVEPVKKRKRKSKMSMSGVQKKKKGSTPLSSLPEYEDNSNRNRQLDDTVKMCIDEIVRRYDPEKHKAVPHELLLMPPISVTETTNKKLVHAELLYTMETSRSEIEKALDDIYTECRFDFDVLYYFVVSLAKKKSIAWYEAPKHFYNRQIAINKQLVGIPRDRNDNDNLLPEHGGSYLICPNCCKIKTAVHPYDPVLHKVKNNSLCSAGVCIDMITGEFTCAKISSKNNPKKRNTTSNIVSELLGKKIANANAAPVDDSVEADDQEQPEQSYIDYLGDTAKEVTEETVDILSAVAAADVLSTGDEIKEAKKASKLKRKTDLYSACNNTRLEQITMYGGILNINKNVVIMCPECATITTLSRSNYRMGSGSVFSCGCFKINYKLDIVCRICKKNVNEPVYRTVYDDLPDMKIPKVRTVPLCRDHRNDWLLYNDRYISLHSIYQKLVGGYYVVKLSDGDSVFVNNDWGPSSRFARKMKEAESNNNNNNNNQ